MSPQVVSIVVALSGPLVAALLSAIGIVLRDWYAGRSRAGSRKLALDDARAQVGFVVDWWGARTSLGESPDALKDAADRAHAWLEEASARVAASEPPVVRTERRVTFRRITLLYPFHTPAGKVVRAAFYLCLILPIWAVALFSAASLSAHSFLAVSPNVLIALGIVAVALALSLRSLAGWIERSAMSTTGRPAARHGAFRSLLLFYPFRSMWAKVVRVAFLGSAVSVISYVAWWIGRLVRVPANVALVPYWLLDSAVYVVLAIGVRAWAVSIERTAQAQAHGERALPGQPDRLPRPTPFPDQIVQELHRTPEG